MRIRVWATGLGLVALVGCGERSGSPGGDVITDVDAGTTTMDAGTPTVSADGFRPGLQGDGSLAIEQAKR